MYSLINQRLLKLLGEGGTPLANTSVTLVGQDNPGATTDSAGLVDCPETGTTLHVRVAGYNDYICSQKMLAERQKVIQLVKTGSADKPYISSVHLYPAMNSGGVWKDAKVDELKIAEGSYDGFEVEITAVWPSGVPTGIYLGQSSKKIGTSLAPGVATLGKTDIGKTTLPDGSSFTYYTWSYTIQPGRHFTEKEPIYAYTRNVFGDNGDSYLTKINIINSRGNTGGSSSQLPAKLPLGKGSSSLVSLPDAAGLLKNTKVGFDLGAVDVSFSIDHERNVKAAIGVSPSKLVKDKKLFEDKETWYHYTDGLKKLKGHYNKSDQLKDFRKLVEKFQGQKYTGKTFFEASIDFEVLGYAEWHIDDDGNWIFKEGYFGAGVKGGAEKTFRGVVGPAVPYYWEFGVELALSLGAELKAAAQGASNPINFNLKLDFEVELKVGGGIGWPKLASAGLYGKVKPGLEIWFQDEITKVKLNASLGVKVTLTPFIKIEHDFLKTENPPTWTWEQGQYKGFGFGSQSLAPQSLQPDYLDFSEASPAPRDYLSRMRFVGNQTGNSIMMQAVVTGAQVKTVDESIYEDSRQKLVRLDNGTKLLFWLRDKAERSDLNRTMLVYSVYNDASSAWSLPVPVADDGTADFYPDIKTDGTRIYAVWHNQSAVLPEGASLADAMAQGEIYAAVYENGAFGPQQRLTNNSTLDTFPMLAVGSQMVKAVWVNNSANDLLGLTGKNNTILYSDLTNGTWGAATVLASGLGAVHNLDATINNGKLYVAYGLDMDNDYSDLSDLEVFQLRVEGGTISTTRLTDDDVMDCAPQYGVIGGQTQLLWYSEGNLKVMEDLDSPVVFDLFPEPNGIVDTFTIGQSTASTNYIIWPQAEGEHQVLYTAVYDGIQWSQPVRVGEVGKKTIRPTAVVEPNGKIFVAYNEIEQLQEGNEEFSWLTDGDASLRVLQADQGADLSISDENLFIDYYQIIPGDVLPLDLVLTNNGTITVQRADIYIGNEFYKTVPISLLPGQSLPLTIDYIVPEAVQKTTLQITAQPNNGGSGATIDENPADNSVTIQYGYAELAVTEVKIEDIDTSRLLTAMVENLSYAPAGAFTVNIRENSEDGPVVFTVSKAGLPIGGRLPLSYSINKRNVQYDENGMKKYFVEIVTSIEEYMTVNNVRDAFFLQEDNDGISAQVLRVDCENNRINVYGAEYNNALDPHDFAVTVDVLDAQGGVLASATKDFAIAAKGHITIDEWFNVSDISAVAHARIQLRSKKAFSDFEPTTLIINAQTDATVGANALGLTKLFRFVPATDGVYQLLSTGDSDAHGYLYDAQGKQLAEADDGGAGGNFRLSYALYAGQTYYYKAAAYNATDFSGITGKIHAPGAASVALTRTGNIVNRTVTYNFSANGGTSATVATATVAQGTNIDLSPTATKAGWRFIGWNTNQSAATALSNLQMGSVNVTLYAIFQREITVTFIDYNGTEKTTRTYDATVFNNGSGGVVLSPAQNACTGWTARGWATERTADAAVVAIGSIEIPVSGATTFYGIYESTVTLSYTNTTANPASQSGVRRFNSYDNAQIINPILSLAAIPPRSGYSAVAWAVGNANGERHNPGGAIQIAANTTMYAMGISTTVRVHSWHMTMMAQATDSSVLSIS